MRKIVVEAEVSVDGAMGGENVDFWKMDTTTLKLLDTRTFSSGVVALHY